MASNEGASEGSKLAKAMKSVSPVLLRSKKQSVVNRLAVGLLAGVAFTCILFSTCCLGAPELPPAPPLLKLPINQPEGRRAFHDSLKLNQSKKGPWGQFEYYEVLLEAPISVLKTAEISSFRSVWYFQKTTSVQVKELLEEMDLPSELEANILRPARWMESDGVVSIHVDREILEQIPNKARLSLYQKLSECGLNRLHVEPEVVFAETANEWLQGYDFPEELLRFVELTCYLRGECLVFSDVLEALKICRSEDERLRFRQALSRTPSVVANLFLSSAPTRELASYWGQGIRFKNTLPFLESISRVPGVEKVDLIHLLPAGVRKILYTFPNPLISENGYLPDCHWTSLNFFNVEPLERLSDPVQATQYTMENFVVVDPPYQCGDVLFFADLKTGDAYHSCAYVADDIVLTKNGRSPLQPWVLMKMDHVKTIYDLHFRTKLVAYRRKG